MNSSISRRADILTPIHGTYLSQGKVNARSATRGLWFLTIEYTRTSLDISDPSLNTGVCRHWLAKYEISIVFIHIVTRAGSKDFIGVFLVMSCVLCN